MNPLSRGLYQGFCFVFASCILSEPEGKLWALSVGEEVLPTHSCKVSRVHGLSGPSDPEPRPKKNRIVLFTSLFRTTVLSRKCQELEVNGQKEPKQPGPDD